MLIDNDNLGKVINKRNPGINLGLFHAKSSKDYFRYFLWRVLKNFVRSETTPHSGSLNAWAFSSLNVGTYTGPERSGALMSLGLARVQKRQFL